MIYFSLNPLIVQYQPAWRTHNYLGDDVDFDGEYEDGLENDQYLYLVNISIELVIHTIVVTVLATYLFASLTYFKKTS